MVGADGVLGDPHQHAARLRPRRVDAGRRDHDPGCCRVPGRLHDAPAGTDVVAPDRKLQPLPAHRDGHRPKAAAAAGRDLSGGRPFPRPPSPAARRTPDPASGGRWPTRRRGGCRAPPPRRTTAPRPPGGGPPGASRHGGGRSGLAEGGQQAARGRAGAAADRSAGGEEAEFVATAESRGQRQRRDERPHYAESSRAIERFWPSANPPTGAVDLDDLALAVGGEDDHRRGGAERRLAARLGDGRPPGRRRSRGT